MNLMDISRNLLPALRVHSWGGLGSQLYTLNLVLELKQRFPYRKIQVLTHTSGVTRRFSELDWKIFNIDVRSINDFTSRSTSDNKVDKTSLWVLPKHQTLKALIAHFLMTLRLLGDANDTANFRKLKPWTVWIRGHYTNLAINRKIVAQMYEKLFRESKVQEIAESLIIHYRLGDLLTLSQKRPIDFRRVENVLRQFPLPQEGCLVVSDSSTSDYVRFVKGSELLSGIKVEHFDSLQAILVCVNANHFIGTGSKISIWSAIFRQVIHSKRSSLPVELFWTSRSGLDSDWY